MSLLLLGLVLLGLFNMHTVTTSAQTTDVVAQRCDAQAIRIRTASFQPGGIILTYFDRDSLWVYDIDRNARYPLPDTAPCGTNCHLSQDARWITYLDATSNAFGKMRLNGTQRTALANYATEVEWWDARTLLIWTPGHEAYLREENGDTITPLMVEGITSVQPGGSLGIRITLDGDEFIRWLVDLNITNTANSVTPLRLGPDLTYFNATAWSPTGEWLAFVAPGDFDASIGIHGGEIYAVRPQDSIPMRRTWLNNTYGAVRINGHASSELSWSPDGSHIAFWVTPLSGPEPVSDLGAAMIHILDIESGQITAYCGFTTTAHTPNPPRLIWSPDGSHIAFGGNIPGDDKGYLLLALNTESGVFTELSNGIYPVFGTADIVAWGLPPQ